MIYTLITVAGAALGFNQFPYFYFFCKDRKAIKCADSISLIDKGQVINPGLIKNLFLWRKNYFSISEAMDYIIRQ